MASAGLVQSPDARVRTRNEPRAQGPWRTCTLTRTPRSHAGASGAERPDPTEEQIAQTMREALVSEEGTLSTMVAPLCDNLGVEPDQMAAEKLARVRKLLGEGVLGFAGRACAAVVSTGGGSGSKPSS